MGATIKDIAQLSGVGISTVSRVLNSSGSASKETREKVIAAAKELKYVPNNNARNLKMVHSKTILLLAKSIVNPFFQEMIKIIQNALDIALIFNAQEKPPRLHENMAKVLASLTHCRGINDWHQLFNVIHNHFEEQGFVRVMQRV